MLTTATQQGPPILLFEASATALCLALAFAFPALGAGFFSRIESGFAWLADRRRLAVAVVGASELLLRLALLPLCPIPKPFVQDDFSFLLAGNTFALGQLTNPTPAMWTHFESIQIQMRPTYMSMYFPAQGLVLAAGKVFIGHAWFGLLCVTALMCAALCWMLQAWLTPRWALLGGLLAVLRIGLFSYWIDTYSGAGSVAALGGALVLGALPRYLATPRLRYSMLVAAGFSILAISRPYEGLLLAALVMFVLAKKFFFNGEKVPARVLLRRMALPVMLLLATAGWMGFYNNRVFGSPWTPPYAVNRATYAAAPYWAWQSPRPEPVYRHKAMRDFYINEELAYAQRLHTLHGFLLETLLLKPLRTLLFFCGLALLPVLVMLPRALCERRIRFLVVCVAVVSCGVLMETWSIPHYFAAITPAIYAIGLEAMRQLRLSKPVGATLLRFLLVACVAMGALCAVARPLHLTLTTWPGAGWTSWWSGPGELGTERAAMEKKLAALPGKELVIVQYSATHNPFDEWVYNEPELDSAKVLWARDMSAAENAELIRYYADRTVWLAQPDDNPAGLQPYAKLP